MTNKHFDPYHRWLGIPPKHQPPDYYRLLALERFEDDEEVIRDAAEQRIAHVRNYRLGEHAELAHQLLNELGRAKACLLDREKKSAYDAGLLENATEQPIEVNVSRTASTDGGVAGVFPQVEDVFPNLSSQKHGSSTRQEPAKSSHTANSERGNVGRFVDRVSSSRRPRMLFAGTCVFIAVLALALVVVKLRKPEADTIAASEKSTSTKGKPDSSNAKRPTDDWRTIDWTAHGIRQWGSVDGKDEIVASKEVSPNSWLLSRRVFDDFVLTAQYTIEQGGAGGIYVRVPEDARFPWSQGFEIHIDDDYGQPPSLDGTGSVYKRAQPNANRARPVNQWNDVRIECRGRELSIWLNGEQVVDYRTPDAFDKSGHIGLDGVTGGITYRNVRIQPLGAN